jgi:hypothetical protein
MPRHEIYIWERRKMRIYRLGLFKSCGAPAPLVDFPRVRIDLLVVSFSQCRQAY